MIVLGHLIDELRPVQAGKKTSNGGWAKNRPPSRYQGIHRPRWDQDEVTVPTELDHVTVSATAFGVTGVVVQKVEHRLDLVTVTDVRLEEVTVTGELCSELGVNIENFKVHNV